MTKRLLQPIFFVFLVVIGVQVSIAQDLIDPEEYAVYSDLLKKTYRDDPASNFAIYKDIEVRFIPDESRNWFRRLLIIPIDADLIKDFNERNKSKAELQNRFNLKSKVQLVGEELREIFKSAQSNDKLFDENDWETFREKYQTFSILSLSRVGFNKKRDKALVVLGSQYGYLAGEGSYYLLFKKRDGWKVKKRFTAWVS